jgi:hypothetical protein
LQDFEASVDLPNIDTTIVGLAGFWIELTKILFIKL